MVCHRLEQALCEDDFDGIFATADYDNDNDNDNDSDNDNEDYDGDDDEDESTADTIFRIIVTISVAAKPLPSKPAL